MKTRLLNKWDSLRASYWFVPSLMALLAVLFSFVTLQLDRTFKDETAWVFGYTRGVDGARSLLSTVAGSVMTVAGVVFSITVAALTLASSQFGPRLLGNFMRDTGNQAVLGTFISTFLYCLLILRTINGQDATEFVPNISVTCGVLLAIASIGVLIFFIHHVASSIQAEAVIAKSVDGLKGAIDNVFPEKIGEDSTKQKDDEPPENTTLPSNFEEASAVVKASSSGYVQAIDSTTLLSLSTEHDLIISLEVQPGDFIINGGTFLRVWPERRLDKQLCDKLDETIILGRQRTVAQDLEFAFQQLVEVALRALSPGINDPFTAISCIDRLGEALSTLAERTLPTDYRYDENNNLRVVAKSITLEGLTNLAFDQIRQVARNHSVVTLVLLKTIGKVIDRARDGGFRQALLAQAQMLERGSGEALPEAFDRQKVSDCYEEVLQSFLKTQNRQPEIKAG